MELKTISASSLQTFMNCPAKYKAENVDRAPRTGASWAADLGTAVHAALEAFVKAVYMDGTLPNEFEVLQMHYDVAFDELFDERDRNYADGLQMLRNWYDRTDLSNVEIISCETKDYMILKTSDGPKRVNYIWDRCDRFVEDGKKIIRVVDYKTIREYVQVDEMKHKIQVRLYAMAAAAQFKDEEPDEIWVCYDLLRYTTVEVKFTREENLKTWKHIKDLAESILATSSSSPPEKLGPGCQWCVRKIGCKSIMKNAAVQGIASLSLEEMAATYEAMEAQNKATKYAMEELSDTMLGIAREENETELEAGSYRIKFSSRKSRSVDTTLAVNILGPARVAAIGKVGITEIDKLLKGNDLTTEEKSQLRGAIRESWGDPKPKVTKMIFKEE